MQDVLMKPPARQRFDDLSLLTISEVMRLWGVSRDWVRDYTYHRDESKRLPSYKLGDSPRYRPAELMHWLENHRTLLPKRRKNGH